MGRLFSAVLIGSFVVSAAWAAEPAGRSRSKQRAEVEAILAKPIDWDLGDRQSVTINDFVEHVRANHGLAIRWDASSLQMMGTDVSALVARLPTGTFPLIGHRSPATTPTFATASRTTRVTKYPPPIAPAAPTPEPLPPEIPPQIAPDEVPPAKLDTVGETAPVAKPKAAKSGEGEEEVEEDELPHLALAAKPIHRSLIAFEGATVGEALAQLLDAAIPPVGGSGEDLGIPMITRALTLDYLVEGRSVVITTHLHANAQKETRVYKLATSKMPPADVAKAIRHSIRPWSWREQATEIADRFAARWPKGPMELPKVAFGSTMVTSPAPVQTASDETPAPLPEPNTSESSNITLKPEDVEGLGKVLTSSALVAWESLVNTIEIAHYGDPPTGVMEVLPGALVITQSQGAHREIQALLDELAEAAK